MSKKATPWPANEPLPSAMTLPEALRVWNISRSTYETLAPLGKFRKFELAAPIGGKRFSGQALERWRRERPEHRPRFSQGVISRKPVAQIGAH